MPTENGHRGRGIGTVTRELLRALNDLEAPHGHSVRYLSRCPISLVPRLQWIPRARTAEWTGVDDRLHSLVSASWQAIETAIGLPRDIERAGADVFLATDPWAIASGASFRTVAMVYDHIPTLFADDYLSGLKRLPRRALLEVGLSRLRSADRLVAISEATRQDTIRLLGVPADRIDVAHLAVDRSIFRPRGDEARALVRQRFGLAEPYFLYVGEIDARKNVPALLAAFERASAAVANVKLVLAGVGEGSRAQLEELLPVALTARGAVVFTGQVSSDELAALYSSAIALTYPSHYEGFGLPILEAMSSGTPVLTSAVSAMPEVAGDAAIYVDSNDIAAITAAMIHLLSDAAVRADLTKRGLARANDFSWRDTAIEILRSCERAVSMPRLR